MSIHPYQIGLCARPMLLSGWKPCYRSSALRSTRLHFAVLPEWMDVLRQWTLYCHRSHYQFRQPVGGIFSPRSMYQPSMELNRLWKLLPEYVPDQHAKKNSVAFLLPGLTPHLDDPVNANDGTVISCGNQNWCCQPNAAAGTCDCGTGDGTFSLQAGIAQTVIGVTGLAFTSTDAVPISSASASSSASSAAAKTTSSPSSSTSSRSASIITSPTTITAALSSSTAALASSASSTDSATPTGITHSTAFIASIAVASAVVSAAIVAILFWLFHRRRRQRVMRGDYIPRSISTANTNTHPPTSEDLLQDPEDYNRPFPTHTTTTTPEPLVNRSRHSLGVAPDHDQGPPEQTSLLYPPALDPYAPPPRDPNELQESYPMQEASGATAPPSYRSNPRGSLRPRGNAYRTMPRVPQPRRPDVAETGQDWFSDQPR